MREAAVEIGGERVARIGTGLLVLVGVEPDDGARQRDRLLERLLAYRVFPDAEGRMNCALEDIGGDLLLVPQFTLAADTSKGNRPGFSTAAPPALGQQLFDELVAHARKRVGEERFGAGRFGADMQVSLVNDGPVTFWLHVR